MSVRTKVFTDPKKLFILILGVSVLLRMMIALYLGNEVVALPGTSDQVSYHNLALRVSDGYGFSFGEPWWPATDAGEPTAHWSYLYTLYLTAVYLLFGPNPIVARLIQAVIVGLLMPWFVYRISQQLFSPNSPAAEVEPDFNKGEWIGLIAAAVTAVYFYFVYYAAALMTESFYIVAILWTFTIAIQMVRSDQHGWRQWVLLGLAIGITVLFRQLYLLFVPFMLLWLWYAARPKLYYLIIPILLLVLMMLPWTIRNYIAFDHFVLLNTNAGYAFFWGNHPIYGTKFIPILPAEMGSYYSLLPPDLLHLNEAQLDSALLKLALTDIMSDPGRYLLLSFSRIPPYFQFWPSSDSSLLSNVARVGSFGLFLPFMAVGLIRSLFYHFPSLPARLVSPFALVYLFMLIYTGIHVFTWTLIRYRLPVDAFLVIFAGLTILWLGEWILSRRASHPRTHTAV